MSVNEIKPMNTKTIYCTVKRNVKKIFSIFIFITNTNLIQIKEMKINVELS